MIDNNDISQKVGIFRRLYYSKWILMYACTINNKDQRIIKCTESRDHFGWHTIELSSHITYDSLHYISQLLFKLNIIFSWSNFTNMWPKASK